MNKWKKAISTGMSAALVASLFTFIAAASVSASVTVTSAGNVPQNGTSAGTATFVLTEQAKDSIATNAAGSIDIVLTDAGSLSRVEFDGTPAVSAPGSLGATAVLAQTVVANDTLRISWTHSDPANIESITITGLAIDADSNATLGAIKATLANATGNGSIGAFQAGGTASGVLAFGTSIGATSATVNVTTTGCVFVNTGAGAPASGKYAFAAGVAPTAAESLDGTAGAIDTPLVGQQVLTITTVGGFTAVHNAGDVVTQTNACAPNGVLSSPGTVVAAITYDNPAVKLTVFPGENNADASNLVIHEPSAGFLAAASTFTYTIATAGVVFSSPPDVVDNNAGMTLSAVSLSADRKSATVTVSTASTGSGATITLQDILYDVAATVPGGTFISVGITTSGGKVVLPASRTNAVVFRGINASATSPTVYIGENAQTAGIVTFAEAAAGFFTAAPGPNNTFEICPNGVDYVFAFAPYAKVVGGTTAGNLILRDGASASTTNIVKGTQDGSCYYWTVWTASTTASTIMIGNADLSAGPSINVDAGEAPGPVLVDLYIGSSALDDQLAATVQFATAVYRNQVSVTALSQPVIPPGATHAAAGNLQIAETGIGQLKADEVICVEVVWRSFVNPDVFFNSLTTADLPVAAASGGVIISPVNWSERDCTNNDNVSVPNQYAQSFSFEVLQQSTTGQGKVVISNINYVTLADAVEGPVQVSVWGRGQNPTFVNFHSTVSNARISSNATAGTNTSRLGVTQTGAFTTATKVQKVGKYVTFRFDFGVANAGAHVDIFGASKSGNDWSAFTKKTARVANASGVVYYYVRSSSASWWSFRASVTGSGTWTPARQARWIP